MSEPKPPKECICGSRGIGPCVCSASLVTKPPPLYRCAACNVAVAVLRADPEPPVIVRGCACDASTAVLAQTTAVIHTVVRHAGE